MLIELLMIDDIYRIMPTDALINPYKYYHNLPIHVKYIIFEGKDGMMEEEWKGKDWKCGRVKEGWKDGC